MVGCSEINITQKILRIAVAIGRVDVSIGLHKKRRRVKRSACIGLYLIKLYPSMRRPVERGSCPNIASATWRCLVHIIARYEGPYRRPCCCIDSIDGAYPPVVSCSKINITQKILRITVAIGGVDVSIGLHTQCRRVKQCACIGLHLICLHTGMWSPIKGDACPGIAANGWRRLVYVIARYEGRIGPCRSVSSDIGPNTPIIILSEPKRWWVFLRVAVG